MESSTTTITTTTITTTTTTTRGEKTKDMYNDQKELFQLLVIIFIDYLYRIFILTPISVIKSCSRHPLSITFLFLFLFPLYLCLQFIISIIAIVSQSSSKVGAFKSFFFGQNDALIHHVSQQPVQQRRRIEDDDDDMQQWLERCSICFEHKLDLCLDYCRDQFCLDCFQKYVSEVVKSSWGLCVTKIRCPVCRVYIPQSEWTKFVPSSIVELYNKFNRPYRSFSRSCPHCEKEVIPCDAAPPAFVFYNSVYSREQASKAISNLIQHYFTIANSHCTVEQILDQLLPPLSYQQYAVKVFNKSEWRNSTLPDIHHQLMTKLIKANAVVDQIELIKRISKEVLQLEMRPDTWRRLQFDHISFFSNMDCPHCNKSFCLKCGHDNTHDDLTCLENMKRLVDKAMVDDEFIQTLKWKLENSRNCPSCSIMINRDEGCNKVDCTLCGFSFCWECKSTWSDDGCGFYNCLVNKSKSVTTQQQNDEDFSYSPAMFEQGGSSATTELGVPNIDMIHSRLNQNSSSH